MSKMTHEQAVTIARRLFRTVRIDLPIDEPTRDALRLLAEGRKLSRFGHESFAAFLRDWADALEAEE